MSINNLDVVEHACGPSHAGGHRWEDFFLPAPGKTQDPTWKIIKPKKKRAKPWVQPYFAPKIIVWDQISQFYGDYKG
jgi:hypothetical protein